MMMCFFWALCRLPSHWTYSPVVGVATAMGYGGWTRLVFCSDAKHTWFENKNKNIMWFNIFMYSKQGTVLVVPAGNPKDADTADENLNGASFSDLWPSNRFV